MFDKSIVKTKTETEIVLGRNWVYPDENPENTLLMVNALRNIRSSIAGLSAKDAHALLVMNDVSFGTINIIMKNRESLDKRIVVDGIGMSTIAAILRKHGVNLDVNHDNNIIMALALNDVSTSIKELSANETRELLTSHKVPFCTVNVIMKNKQRNRLNAV